mmetsp:Transcript_22120/g.68670  ORF Transcript_22120/g.68670 Transcript_22120/m.68670 type:complete len:300 (-) Transcript_22120:3306-4205(-)
MARSGRREPDRQAPRDLAGQPEPRVVPGHVDGVQRRVHGRRRGVHFAHVPQPRLHRRQLGGDGVGEPDRYRRPVRRQLALRRPRRRAQARPLRGAALRRRPHVLLAVRVPHVPCARRVVPRRARPPQHRPDRQRRLRVRLPRRRRVRRPHQRRRLRLHGPRPPPRAPGHREARRVAHGGPGRHRHGAQPPVRRRLPRRLHPALARVRGADHPRDARECRQGAGARGEEGARGEQEGRRRRARRGEGGRPGREERRRHGGRRHGRGGEAHRDHPHFHERVPEHDPVLPRVAVADRVPAVV